MAKMSEQGVQTHHWRAVERGQQQGSLTHFSQCFPSGQHIRIVYAIVQMELHRIALRRLSAWESGYPCTLCVIRERSPYTLHTGKNSIQLEFHLIQISHSRMGEEDIPCADILHPDILQPNGRGGRFDFSRYTYLDLLITLTCRVFLSVQCSGVLLNLPDIFDRYF